MYCRYCGNKIEDGDKYCSRCGKPILDNSVISNHENTNNIAPSARPLKKIPFIPLRKQKPICILLYIIFLLLSIFCVESYIDSKKERLRQDIIDGVGLKYGEDVSAMAFDETKHLEIRKTTIPPYPKNGDANELKYDQEHWKNMFGGMASLYKITDGGWWMEGRVLTIYPNSQKQAHYGYLFYNYFPVFICSPNGSKIELDLAKSIVSHALDVVYRKPDRFNKINFAYSNSYYNVMGSSVEDYPMRGYVHAYAEDTGNKPILDEHGKKTEDNYYGMVEVGMYRVILGYKSDMGFGIHEKNGFSASLKDRVLLYGGIGLCLTLLLLFSLRKISIAKQLSDSEITSKAD